MLLQAKDCCCLFRLPNMFSISSTIAFIALSASFNSVACGVHGEETFAYQAIGNCIEKGWKDVGKDIQQNGGHVKKETAKEGELCIFFRAFVPCILRATDRFPAKSIKVIIAYEWQHMVLSEKSGLCSNLPFQNLMKKIGLEADITDDKEKFVNIEEDNYEGCAGDVLRKCLVHTVTGTQEGAYKGFMYVVRDYVDCFRKEANRPEDSCHAEIMMHFIGNFEAYLNYLEEEGNGQLAKILEEIAPPF